MTFLIIFYISCESDINLKKKKKSITKCIQAPGNMTFFQFFLSPVINCILSTTDWAFTLQHVLNTNQTGRVIKKKKKKKLIKLI